MQGSSRVFVTADNPRSESIDQIFSDMGFQEGSAKHFNQLISYQTVSVLYHLPWIVENLVIAFFIAGKGYETYQEFDGSVIPFDDRQVARELLHLKSFKVGD